MSGYTTRDENNFSEEKHIMENQNHVTAVTSQNAPSRAELEQLLRARAGKDDAFRQEFLTNPKAVLERDYARWLPEGNIPSGLSIKVIEEEEQAIYFVLPPKTADDHSEMDDIDEQDLVDVPGGAITQGCSVYSNSSWCCKNKLIKAFKL
jgi:hypothetical protein